MKFASLAVSLFLLSGSLGGATGLAAEPANSTRPNIVLILADDLGYADIGCYGGPNSTPHLDGLAERGVRFTDFHSNGPVCTPTRAALVTGRYQQRCGLEAVLSAANHRDQGLALDETTFAEVLNNAGYATALFGKWHLGYQKRFNPIHQGFSEFHGYLSGNVDYFSHVDQEGYADWWHGDQLVQEQGYTTDLITEYAVRFVAANKSRPFCIYLAHEAVHYPYQTRDDAAFRQVGVKPERVVGSTDDQQKAYAGMLSALDESTGRILDALKKHDLSEQTLVFFTSDNGPAGPGQAGPLSGKKGSLLEGGHRVPAIASWPGQIDHRESDAFALTMDLLPTFARLAGARLPENVSFDGVDLSGHLLENESLPGRTVFWRYRKRQAVRLGPWKLHVPEKGPPKLFHLGDDLAEKKDLAGSQSEKVAELRKALEAWDRSVAESVSQ